MIVVTHNSAIADWPTGWSVCARGQWCPTSATPNPLRRQRWSGEGRGAVSLLARKMRRDVRARRGQFAAVVVTVFLGLVLFALSYDAYANLKASYRRVFDITHFADFTVSGGDTACDPRRRGAAAGRVGELRTPDRRRPRARGRPQARSGGWSAFPRPDSRPIDGVIVLDGTYLSPARDTGVLVEKHMAEHFELRPGDRLEVLGSDGWLTVDVLGKAASAEYLWPAPSRQEILASPDDFGVLFVPEPLLDSCRRRR